MFSFFDIYPLSLFKRRMFITKGIADKVVPDNDLVLPPVINVLGSYNPLTIRNVLNELSHEENLPKEPVHPTFLSSSPYIMNFFRKSFPGIKPWYKKAHFYDKISSDYFPYLHRNCLNDKQFELVYFDKDISDDWKLFLLGQRITSIIEDGKHCTSVADDVANLKKHVRNILPLALVYVHQKGNDENLTRDFYDNFIGTTEIILRLQTYYVASFLTRFEEQIKKDNEKEWNLLFELISESMSEIKLFIDKELDNNGDSSFRIDINSLNPPSSYELFGTMFHEIEHNIIEYKYGLKAINIHGESIHEFICDLSEIANNTKYISADVSKLRKEFSELKYKKHYKNVYLFCDDFTAEEHIAARAFLQSIIEQCDGYPERIKLLDVMKELYSASHIVLARHSEKKDLNELRFTDFCKEMIEEANLNLDKQGFKFQIYISNKTLSLELLKAEINILDPSANLTKGNSKKKNWGNRELIEIINSGTYITEVPYVIAEFV